MASLASVAISNPSTIVGDLCVDGAFTVSNATNIANVDSIDHRVTDGDGVERFKAMAEYIDKWSDPLQYREEIRSNGNNIRYVYNPTKDDYLFAIEHGSRPEFIDKTITKKDIEEYMLNNPARFV